MAEVVGLVVGGASLAVSFKACIDLIDCVCAARDINHDYSRLITKLDIEKALLLQWAAQTKLLDTDHQDTFTNASLLHKILQDIRSLLSDNEKLQKRYGLRPLPSTPVSGEECRLSLTDNAQLANVMQALAKMRITTPKNEMSDRPMAQSRQRRWMVYDKAKFEELLRELSGLVSNLNDLTQHSLTHSLISASRQLGEKTKVLEVAQSRAQSQLDEPLLSSLLDARVKQLATKRIMDALWFRSMDDRRAALAMPHAGTFEWALKDDTSSIRWHSLPQWLEEGSGVYWISGKAGAGKSTLMKFIHDHSRTTELLQTWANTSTLTVASFFFYHLGTDEQKSQQGLFRALLHEIFVADSSLIQTLLPNMWREAFLVLSDDRLLPPSQSEIDYAFSQLSSSDLSSRKYCFFIDGLDEFSGNISEGVGIVQKLAAAPNMKVLVSSRPMVQCAAAFSSCPRLELQDLTRLDMEAYVQEHIGSHANMKSLLLSQPLQAEQLMTDLINKASGVFLWLVLVCRTFCESLDGSDRLTDLEQRIDELPEGLDALFRRIFETVAPAHRDYATCMLHAFCEAYRLGLSGFQPLPVAHADDHMFDTARAIDGSLKQENGIARCKALQDRLRHRCRGLLELHDQFGGTYCDHCILDRNEQQLSDKVANQVCCDQCQLERLVQSHVQLIHRSLLSYLENDGSSHFARKRNGPKVEHDHMVLLACMLMYQLYRFPWTHGKDVSELLSIMLSCISQIDQKMTRQFWFLYTELLRYTSGKFETRTKMYGVDFKKDPLLAEQSLALAAEIGHEGLFREVWNVCGYGPLNKLSKMATGATLLYHTFERPILQAYFGKCGGKGALRLPTLEMTRLLLSAGCDPNALSDDKREPWMRLSVWTIFLNFRLLLEQDVLPMLEVCRMYLEYGADLAVARQLVEDTFDRSSPGGRSSEAGRFWNKMTLLLDEFEPDLDGTAAALPTSTSHNKPGSSWKRRALTPPCSDSAKKRLKIQALEDLDGGVDDLDKGLEDLYDSG